MYTSFTNNGEIKQHSLKWIFAICIHQALCLFFFLSSFVHGLLITLFRCPTYVPNECISG